MTDQTLRQQLGEFIRNEEFGELAAELWGAIHDIRHREVGYYYKHDNVVRDLHFALLTAAGKGAEMTEEEVAEFFGEEVVAERDDVCRSCRRWEAVTADAELILAAADKLNAERFAQLGFDASHAVQAVVAAYGANQE